MIQPAAQHWTIGEACHGATDGRAAVHLATSGAQAQELNREELIEARCVSGGEVSAEGHVHGIQSPSWALIPTG